MNLIPTPQPLINLEHSFSSNALDIEVREFIDILNVRERAIFETRILPNSSAVLTLQELADRFDVTREAIRLAELKVLARVEELKHNYFSFGLDVAHQFCNAIGTITPISFLTETLAKKLQQPTGQLVCFLAGKYVITSDGLITKLGHDTNVHRILESTILESDTSQESIEETETLICNLVNAGMTEWVAETLVRSSTLLGHFETRSFLIPESLNQKFRTYLRLTNSPASLEDAMPFLCQYGQVNERSLKNAIAADPEIMRVGVNTYGLAEWDLPLFKNLLESMESFLSTNGPTAIAELCEQLHIKYGANKKSITMYAQMHHRFVQQNGFVRLRESHEPVIYGLKIDQESYCFRSGKKWTWRITVDNDLLRGSGLFVPRGLAAHLELLPNEPQKFNHQLGTSIFNWTGINPSISSLKSVSEFFKCILGDFIFLTVDRAGKSIDFEIRAGYSQEFSAEENLRNYFCAAKSESAEESACRALGINLNGAALRDFLSMRAENSNDRTLQQITRQMSK